MDGPGFETWWGVKISASFQTDLEGHQFSCAMGTGALYLRKSSWNVALTTHPHIVPRLKKE
jgi:hypothetical protein